MLRSQLLPAQNMVGNTQMDQDGLLDLAEAKVTNLAILSMAIEKAGFNTGNSEVSHNNRIIAG